MATSPLSHESSLPSDTVDPEENIVRAICTDKWDGERISPSLFVGENTSVSRPKIVPLEDHWEMFRQHVQRPPERLLAMIGEINVGQLQRISRSYVPPTELTVKPEPRDWNPAHAVIPQRITRGLANKIIKAPEFKLHQDPQV